MSKTVKAALVQAAPIPLAIGDGITEEYLNTLNKTTLPDRSSGERIPIGDDVAATLRACMENGTWPDWVPWFKETATKYGAEGVQGRIGAAIDRAKWPQTVQNVLEEIYYRSEKLMVFQTDKKMPVSLNNGEVLPLEVT